MSGDKKCIITFHSVHQALRAEKILMHQGIIITVLPVPRKISSDCGIAIQFPCEEEVKIKTVLETNRVTIEGFHHIEREKR